MDFLKAVGIILMVFVAIYCSYRLELAKHRFYNNLIQQEGK